MTAARASAPLRVALTFDAEHPDRPTNPDAETRLLGILESAAIPATFFIQGRWAEACPERARRITDGPHVIGSHGFYHARMTLLSAAGLRADICDAETAILDVTGRDPRPWFRCPFGAGMEDARVLAAITAAGYRHVGWDVNVEDWMSGRDAQTIASCLVRGVLERQKAGQADSIVLLHSWPAATGAGIEMAVARLRREAGAQFVTVDELLPA